MMAEKLSDPLGSTSLMKVGVLGWWCVFAALMSGLGAVNDSAGLSSVSVEMTKHFMVSACGVEHRECLNMF